MARQRLRDAPGPANIALQSTATARRKVIKILTDCEVITPGTLQRQLEGTIINP
jgi:hypothetical protein